MLEQSSPRGQIQHFSVQMHDEEVVLGQASIVEMQRSMRVEKGLLRPKIKGLFSFVSIGQR